MSASVDRLIATAVDVRSTARDRDRVRAARAVLEALRPGSPKAARKPVAPARSPAELQAMLAELRAKRERLERVS